jgi:DNA repair exonuclease SbcCD ATPase subunit
MRIIHLRSENVKRIKAVDITPTGDVIVISGKNEQGKTSTLDAIWLALQYRAASRNNPDPLRNGEKKGTVELDLGDYLVTRKFTPSGTTLEIKTPDGSKISSPQKLLDGMIGDMSFDPWVFSRKSVKEQRDMLGDVLYTITGGKVDLADFEQRHKKAFDERADANREKKRLTTLLTNIKPPTDAEPTLELSVTDLTQSITDAVTLNARTKKLTETDARLKEKILSLEQQLAAAKEQRSLVISELEDLPDVPDIEFLKEQLQNIETHNRRAREIQDYGKIRKSLRNIEEQIVKLNNSMELIDIEKAEALEKSPLPVKGLMVTAEGIMVLNEEGLPVPFCQASAAQRLRISLGIAMAANPKLRIIRIADGSLLDDGNMKIVEEMAQDKDFQVWIEYASRNDNDRMGVYIEDGTVA